MKKKVMMSVMAAAMALSSSITALAAPEVISVNGKNTVFDWEYYAGMYPDVTAELGAGREAMIQHYASYGQREGREAYAAGTDVEAVLAAYQEAGITPTETVTPVQTEKKQPIREEYYYTDRDNGSLILSRIVYYEYDAQGNVIKERTTDGSGYFFEQYENTYDAQGNKTKEVHSVEDYGKWETTYSYDSQGNVIKAESRGLMEGCGNSTTTYSYDSQGNLISEDTRSAEDPSYWRTYTCSYDSRGNVINEVFVNDGELDSWMNDNSYDDRGDCIQTRQTWLKPDGSVAEDAEPVYRYFTYTYDGSGNLIKEVQEEKDPNLRNCSYITEYSYDSQGNMLTEVRTQIDGYNDAYPEMTQYIYE